MADEELVRGTKRKRFEPKQKDQGVKITGKLHHALKEVRKAAKKAKTFETQKLVKKLKSLRSKEGKQSEITDLESQLEFLKDMDHELIAHTATHTKLSKDRLLSENAHVQHAIAVELPPATLLVPSAPAGTPRAKVESRLLSAKGLAVEVATVVAELRGALVPKVDLDEEEEEKKEEVVVERPAKVKKVTTLIDIASTAVESHGEDDNDEDEEEEIDESGWESGSIPDDAGWESGSIDEAPHPQKAKPNPPKVAPPKTKTKAGESTFLPSLAVGYVRGDSAESDWSDGEGKGKGAEVAPRKNRRGQQARRAIWEKKFGRNANHKKKEQDEQATAQRRNPPAAARGSGGKGVPQFHQPKDGGWGARSNSTNHTNTNTDNTNTNTNTTTNHTNTNTHVNTTARPAYRPPPRRPEEKPLHPSWEAKKKLKEKQSAGIVPSQGTKIKF